MEAEANRICMNEYCGRTTSVDWRRGWVLKSGGSATLCFSCGLAYYNSTYCLNFHKAETGWRTCVYCKMPIHCGCIASKHLHDYLDFGGVGCIKCVRDLEIQLITPIQNDVSNTRPQSSVPENTTNFLGKPNELQINKENNFLTTITQIDRQFPCRLAPQSFRPSILSRPESSSTPKGFRHILDSLITHHSLNFSLASPALPFSDGEWTSNSNNALLPFTNGASTSNIVLPFNNNNGTAGTSNTAIPFTNGDQGTSNTSLPFTNSEGTSSTAVSFTTSGSGTSSDTPHSTSFAFTDGESIPNIVVPFIDQTVLQESENDQLPQTTEHFSRGTGPLFRVPRPPGEGRGHIKLVSRYWPRITDQELQQLSGDLNSTIVPLFEKVLSASDTGRIGRLVLPKACAEAYFPCIEHSEGVPIEAKDINGKDWTFQFRFWPNNNSRMYVLEGITPCLLNMQLRAGDTVIFCRIEPSGQLLMGYRKATDTVDLQDPRDLTGETSSYLTENLHADSPNKEGTSSEESLERPTKKRARKIGSKSKRLLIDSDDSMKLMISWKEGQILLRPPIRGKPRIVIVDNQEFEEYDVVPLIRGKLSDSDELPSAAPAATSGHPRHRPGCTCVVCIQSSSGKGKICSRKNIKCRSERKVQNTRKRPRGALPPIDVKTERGETSGTVHPVVALDESGDRGESSKGRLDLNLNCDLKGDDEDDLMFSDSEGIISLSMFLRRSEPSIGPCLLSKAVSDIEEESSSEDSSQGNVGEDM